MTATKESPAQQDADLKARPYLQVTSDVFGDRDDWSPADRLWGWVFGTYELWDIDKVCQFLGDCSRKTIERLRGENKLRFGRTAESGGAVLYCSRSVVQHARSLER